MTAKDLKNALLQEAVQGKLVPQIASEGNAKDLLEEIKKEKAKAAGKASSTSFASKTRTKELPPITDDEIPFDIPENWSWCRLGEVFQTCSGTTPQSKNPEYYNNGTIYWVRTTDLNNSVLSTAEIKITEKAFFDCNLSIIPKNSVCLALYGGAGTIGKNAILNFETTINQSVCAILPNTLCEMKYVLYFLQYQRPNWMDYASGSRKDPNINQIIVKNCPFPLPPLAEQKRIVAAIEQFMPLIEEYGKKEAELTTLNADIAKTLKNAILQEAVQGKLAPQIATEGNAKDLLEEIKKEKAKLIKEGKLKKEKPLPEITEDEISFDIPENWCWCRLGDLVQVISGISYDKKDVSKDGYRILRGGNIQNSKIIIEDDDVFLPELYLDEPKLIRKGDILIVASTGSKAVIGKPGFVEQDIPNTMIGAFLRICRSYSLDTIGYLRYLFESDFYRKHIRDLSQGTNINNVKESYITEFVIPLPPLEEQKRIVEAIEKMLPLCEKVGE